MSGDTTTIERVLFVANNVHVYGIPPISSNKGFNASGWTSPTQPTAQEIFQARLRVIERSRDSKITAEIVLEDPNTGELFAGCPYTNLAAVQQALDSSRFFAVRVQGEGGMKATLGIGFEDRSPAFDFSIALREVRKVLGISEIAGPQQTSSGGIKQAEVDTKQDFSLKEGEKIHIQIGQRGRRAPAATATSSPSAKDDNTALFSIAPPPPASKASHDPSSVPPPAAIDKKQAADLGFDDGDFGEFQ